jgi:hypothetical protein
VATDIRALRDSHRRSQVCALRTPSLEPTHSRSGLDNPDPHPRALRPVSTASQWPPHDLASPGQGVRRVLPPGQARLPVGFHSARHGDPVSACKASGTRAATSPTRGTASAHDPKTCTDTRGPPQHLPDLRDRRSRIHPGEESQGRLAWRRNPPSGLGPAAKTPRYIVTRSRIPIRP